MPVGIKMKKVSRHLIHSRDRTSNSRRRNARSARGGRLDRRRIRDIPSCGIEDNSRSPPPNCPFWAVLRQGPNQGRRQCRCTPTTGAAKAAQGRVFPGAGERHVRGVCRRASVAAESCASNDRAIERGPRRSECHAAAKSNIAGLCPLAARAVPFRHRKS
jgi:hypothetical protein